GQTTMATGAAFEYDVRGFMIGSNGLAVPRDATGRIAQVTLAPGKAVQYTYDRRNRVVQISDWLGGSTTFSYDADGRVIAVTRPNGVMTAYGYDAEAQVTSIVESVAGSALSSISLQR